MSNVVLLVVKGKAFLQEQGIGRALSAPPGPALVFWDNVQPKATVETLQKLPPQVKPPDKKLLDQVSTCVSCVMSGPVRPALQKLVRSENKIDRLVAVTMQGAVDDVPGLLDSLGDAKHAEVREHAIVVLRNWIGREPGQVKKLYLYLVKKKSFSRIQALSALQLLFGFDEEQWKTPGIYQMLIEGLRHKKLAARQLAYWHLVRLAPSGKDIPYDPAGTEEQREKGVARWRQLIPPGHLAPWLEKRKKQVGNR